ncbi:MAG: addiction module protein [Burkholderiaceae bacterium]
MGAKLEALEADAMALTEEERVELAERLLASLSREDGVEDAWSAEIRRRIAAIEAGEMKYVPVEEAIVRARKAIE